jgi:peptidoglycan/LPS O-acetylase OafA/YrhL
VEEFDGLRGLAMLGVFFFHARQRMAGCWLYAPACAGWAGVTLFFVLSGYLITTILLSAREGDGGHYYRNFYGKRALRILPVYALFLFACFCGPDWLLRPALGAIQPWKLLACMILFVQNLLSAPLLGAIEPTWALAIEQQYYLLWAPVIKLVRRNWLLAGGLAAAIVASPMIRYFASGRLNSMHTLFHLDGLAFGSLLAVAIMTCDWKRRTWWRIAAGMAVSGIGALAFARGSCLQDSAIGLICAAAVLLALLASGVSQPFTRFLRRGPLVYYGKVSYGFYLCHVPVIMSLGLFYEFVDRGTGGHILGANLAVVAVQLAMSTAVAALLQCSVERPLLACKRYFRD